MNSIRLFLAWLVLVLRDGGDMRFITFSAWFLFALVCSTTRAADSHSQASISTGRPIANLPAGFEFYNPASASYVMTTSSDGKYRGLLNRNTGLWAYGQGSFVGGRPETPPPSETDEVGPDGRVWGPVIRNVDHSVLFMNYDQATICCNGGASRVGYPASCPFGENGAHLPSIQEFLILRLKLGWPSWEAPESNNYNPGLVADLSGHWFWTSSPDNADAALIFNGTNGQYDSGIRYYSSYAVRCVR